MSLPVYYNEIDPYCAAWLKNLMDAGQIPAGDIDTRSIEDVKPDELRGYRQCHFFAGLGGWAYALKLAGWGDRPVWTGSCPCQPFSAAGKGAGFADQRHLWPAWFHLISQCRPPTIFGEQVASKAVDPWIDLVHADLEAVGYAFGSIPFPATGVGAPHIRDRNYWVGHADDARLERFAGNGGSTGREGSERRVTKAGVPVWMADTKDQRLNWRRPSETSHGRDAAWVESQRLRHADDRPGPVNGHWRDADWLGCRDGKWRPVEPGTQPLAHGVSGRVGRLRAYGNAIVPQVASEFISTFIEAEQMMRAVIEVAA